MVRLFWCFFLLSRFSFASADTFDPTRLELFYSDLLYEQSVILDTHLGRPVPLESGIRPPPGKLGYAPLVITNQTGLDASRLYVIGKGQTLAATDAYFLQPNLTTGICSLVSSGEHNSADSNISVSLSRLPSAGENSYFLYVPQMVSGRFYLSVDTPLYMETAVNQSTGHSVINDPSQTTMQDPNYYTIYQNFEFTLDQAYDLYANVSNVDYFSVPFTLASHSFPTGNLYPTLDHLTVVGYPSTSSRSSILSGIQSGLLSGDASDPLQWPNLSIPFYSNPYALASPLTYLRIIAAKLSIALGISSDSIPFRGAATPQATFDAEYLQNADHGPIDSESYMEALYNYYLSHELQTTIFPANQPQATYTLVSDVDTAGVLLLTLNSGTGGVAAPEEITVNLNNLTTEALLGGDVGVWVIDNVFTPSATDPWQTEIAKIISTLFTAGMLPPPTSLSQPIVSNATYFSQYRDLLFANPQGFTNYGPWFNLYDKVIHPLLVQTNGIGLGYAYDYDDLLDIAGLLHVNIQSGGTLNEYQPYVVLTAGPVDTPIPNTKGDFGPYNIHCSALGSESFPIDIIYSTSPSATPNLVASVDPSLETNVSGLYNYFYVRYYTDLSQTTYLDYAVYPKYQLVLPTTTRYNHQDVALMNGIVFLSGTDGVDFHFSIPNTNPFPE